MFCKNIKIRVRYGETDRMGYVYYANYAEYFEVARVNCLRTMGITYKEIEDKGILLPVYSYSVKFYKPAFYDDILTIETYIKKLPLVKFTFYYKTYNEKNELINEAETTLVFIDRKKNKACKVPDYILNTIKKHFK